MTEEKDRQSMSDRELLIRLDERMEGCQSEVSKINNRLDIGSTRIGDLEGDVKMLKDRWNIFKWLAGAGGLSGLSGIGLWIKSQF